MTKKPRTRGHVSQKMMSFRLDNINSDWLQLHPNKGRYINTLIRNDNEFDFSLLAEKLRKNRKACFEFEALFDKYVF